MLVAAKSLEEMEPEEEPLEVTFKEEGVEPLEEAEAMVEQAVTVKAAATAEAVAEVAPERNLKEKSLTTGPTQILQE